MRFKTLDVVSTLLIVIALILSISALFMGDIKVQACVFLSAAVLMAAGWVSHMIGIFKK
jgi:hypothetical protein